MSRYFLLTILIFPKFAKSSPLPVDDLRYPLDHARHLLLVLASPHPLHLVSIDLAVVVNIEGGVSVQITRRQP